MLKYTLSTRRSFSTHSVPQPSSLLKVPWRPSLGFSRMGTNLQALRFASTAPIASTDPTSSGPTESVAVPTDDFNTPSVEDITADLPPVPETLGYLKDLGLDFGWGPTAFVEYLLEHVHIYTATPWWASILLTALAVRLALLKPYIDASDTSTRVVTMTELAKPIKARLDAAKSCRDQVAVMQAAQEMKALYQQAGIKLWKTTVPLLQVPIGYGTFRLLRRMAELPVPGLEDGGFLWLKDLTISDPYYLLPALTGWAIHLTFKVRDSCRLTTLGNRADVRHYCRQVVK